MVEDKLNGQHPLQWPAGYIRTGDDDRKRGRFGDINFTKLRTDLARELRLLGAEGAVVTSNIPLRNDGQPRASYRNPDDPGVSVYFTLKGQRMCMASDKFTTPEANLRAIKGTVEGMRMIQRYGCSDMLERAFSGFTALGDGTTWWQVMEFEAMPETFDEVKSTFRRLTLKYHNDVPGVTQADKMVKLNQAREDAVEHFDQ